MFYAVDTQFSLIFNNSSCYDPYWSILPPLILGHQLGGKAFLTGRDYVIAVVVLIWGARLTYNWLRSFKTWSHQGKLYKYFLKGWEARVLIKLDRPVCLASYSQKGSLKIPPIATDFLLAYKIC